MKKNYAFTAFFLLLCFAATAQCTVDALPAYDCMGNCSGAAQAMATGASPFTYSWSNGDTGNSADSLCMNNTYVVTMTDNIGCIATDTVYMIGGMVITNHAVTNTSCSSCCDGSDTITASFSSSCTPLTYQWYGPSGMTPPTSNNYMGGLCFGTYTVVLTDACGCSGAWTFSVGTGSPTAVVETAATPVTLSQAGNLVHISSVAPIDRVELFDLQGRLLYTRENAGGSLELLFSEYDASVLIVTVTAGGEKISRTVLKE